MRPLPLHACSVAAALLASCNATFEPAEIEPTPQRPRISKNTRTTVKSTVELEAGVTWDPNDFFDTPVTLKYGLTDNIEYFVETSPLRIYDFPGSDETGIGDVALGLRHRFDDGGDGGAAFAFELMGKLPTSDDPDGRGTGGIDPRIPGAFTGATDLRIAGIAQQRTGDLDVSGYIALNALGVPQGGTSYQVLAAGAVATPISESDTVFGELVGTFTEGISSTFLVQGGIARRIAANMTADAAVGIGLESDAPAFYLMLGLTTNFGYVR
ncbi:MAG: transporter [Planctomycetota bacterium]